MPVKRPKVEDPCQNCRDRHLKCDDHQPRCRQCERLKDDCVRSSTSLKFRVGSSAKYDANFKKDQPWLEQSKHAKIQFVDQTPELENYYALDDDAISHTSIGDYRVDSERHHAPPPPATAQRQHITSSPAVKPALSAAKTAVTSPNVEEACSVEPAGHKRQRTNESTNASYLPQSPLRPTSSQQFLLSTEYVQEMSLNTTVLDTVPSPQFETPSSLTQAVEAEYRRLADTAAAAIPSADSGLLSPEVWKKKFFWPNAFTTTQCACLMRYYVEELAPWFDVCDPARHFTNLIPQRARRCPPLLNAIFTAAARHLVRVKRYRTAEGAINYHGIRLRDLTDETAIRYHNACLAYLIELSTHPDHVKDENLLAAAAILRYYEELDTSLTGEDPETFLHTFQVFANAQASTTFSPLFSGGYEGLGSPMRLQLSTTNALQFSKTFRHASFRIALRQEITSAFTKQRAVCLPLEGWAAIRSFEDAEDDVWTDRLIVFCADVLQYCFGDENAHGRSQIERWKELKAFDRWWEHNKPFSFGAIHYQDADSAAGEVFPQLWYLAECHVAGMQYLDLARILLTVYDPTIPRLGPGAAAATRRTAEEVRKLVLRLCGIALSNRASQPALVLASIAISVCGEYFTDRDQQRGMLDLLYELDDRYAWPTDKIAKDLKTSWGWGTVDLRDMLQAHVTS